MEVLQSRRTIYELTRWCEGYWVLDEGRRGMKRNVATASLERS